VIKMKVYLRLGKNNGIKIQKAENVIFAPTTSKKITVFPIPPFLKSAKCECGNKADLILEDMAYICSKCVEGRFKNMNDFKKVEDVSIPLTTLTIFSLSFEWSVNQHRWYTIYGRNLKPKNWNRFLSKIRDVILNNRVIIIDVDYEKETKEMTIH